MHTVGWDVRGPQGQLLGGGDGTLLPVVVHREVVDTRAERAKQEPREFPGMQTGVEGFEARNLLADSLRDAVGLVMRDHVDIVQPQAQHTLRLELGQQGAHGIGVGVGGRRPLGGRALVQQDQGADQCRAPLDRSDKARLPLDKIARGVHRGALPIRAPCPARRRAGRLLQLPEADARWQRVRAGGA